ELWQAVMGSNPSYFQTSTNAEYGTILKRPVEQVSWYDCQEFITKLNQITGKTFRLPTEAEWEFAARGGNKSQGYIYPGSNDYEEVAFYWHNSGPEVNPYGGPKTTHPVAQKKPNELGLYDMSGNVNEWCHDWYSATYYSESPTDNPTGPADPVSIYPARVVRGDAYDDWIAFYDEEDFAVWERGSARPNNKSDNLGLRLVLGDPLPEPNAEPTVQSLTATDYHTPHNYLSNTGAEGYAKLVDGDKSTKWCVENYYGGWETIWVDLKSSVAFKPTSYVLTTGNDTSTYPNRNPKNWKIYGRNSESESWTELAHVTDGGGLEPKNTTDYTFEFSGVTKAYQYYRFEVSEIGGRSGNNYVFQLAELTLLGVAAQ
ncbi:MAG: SUMF1/EgtB/PvdO family nonheme iron enzyme, partial [Muribaculaceae bacterium]|nr:SUMF1/EgtB/PvdO family nonheme iron enzyme [Muribaculaceae bacterium]